MRRKTFWQSVRDIAHSWLLKKKRKISECVNILFSVDMNRQKREDTDVFDAHREIAREEGMHPFLAA